MIFNLEVIVFEEMFKFFEYIKKIENLIKDEIDWFVWNG